MKVEFLPSDVQFWMQPRQIPPRSDGPHVSSLILRLLKRVNPRKYEEWGKDQGRVASPKWEVGYTWEDIVSATLNQRIALQPGDVVLPAAEIRSGTLFGTPDRVVYSASRARLILDEMKGTWYSSNHLREHPERILDSAKFYYWILQGKTYAAMLMQPQPASSEWPREMRRWEFDFTPELRIRALFLNGDYRGGEFPDPIGWRFTWTTAELRAWLDLCLEEATLMAAPNTHTDEEERISHE